MPNVGPGALERPKEILHVKSGAAKSAGLFVNIWVSLGTIIVIVISVMLQTAKKDAKLPVGFISIPT